ncbi:MAG TPA: hypothetical protein DCM25_01020 [Rhodobacteraceae bacterium]|nr:hypothetical protein [Paracoccaceae bacterium]
MILNGIINPAKSFFGRCVGSVVTRSAIDTLKKYLRCGAWAQTIKEHQPASSPDVNTIMQTGTNVYPTHWTLRSTSKTFIFADRKRRFKLVLTNAGSDVSIRFLLPE